VIHSLGRVRVVHPSSDVRDAALACGCIREVVAVGDANRRDLAILHELADFTHVSIDTTMPRYPITHPNHLVRLYD
jgi:hypothetical protein